MFYTSFTATFVKLSLNNCKLSKTADDFQLVNLETEYIYLVVKSYKKYEYSTDFPHSF